jgi:cell division septal protein FtsQ
MMFGKKLNTNKNYLRGGYRQYRAPSVFGGKTPKRKKEREKIKVNYKLILYIIVIILAVYYVFFSGKFVIKEVIVEGNHLVSSERISSYGHKGTNILFINSTKLRNQILEENPQIQDVQVIRGIPDAVKIIVLEHENKIVWQTGGIKYLVSTQGVVTKKIEEGETYTNPLVSDSKNLPVVLGTSIVSPNFIAFVTNINDKFFEITNIKPTYFEIPQTTFDLYLYTEAGFYVKFNTMRSSSKQLENLKKVLVEKRDSVKEYVDLRIDGWAYYK